MQFQVHLFADRIICDLEYAPDPLRNTFPLRIANNYSQTLYFKIVLNVPNWSIESPTDGKLGGVGSGGDTYRVVTISRSKPTDEVTETGTITVEAYTDSEYTNKIDEATLNVTIEVVNIKTWTVLGWTFDDGTSQGWTISGEISDERSVITGGYSMRHHAYSGETTAYIEKTIALPSGTKCIGIVYIKGRCWANRYIAWRVTKVVVKVNGNIIYEWKGASFYDTNGNVGSAEFPWRKIAFDLSQYTDQTITLRIEVTAETYYCADGCNQVIYLDDPTIGVK